MNPKLIATGLMAARGTITGVIDTIRNGQSLTSITDLSRPTQINPIVVLDKPLRESEAITSILQSLCSIYSAYYLQAFELVCNVDRIETLRVLDRLNPTRSVQRNSLYKAGNVKAGNESFDDLHVDANGVPALEAARSNEIYEDDSLAVGKLLSVEFTEASGNKVKIPIMVSIRPVPVPSDTMTHIVSAKGKDNSFAERWFLWRSGQISFFKDLIGCTDLLDAHTQTLAKDKSGIYMDIVNNRSRNKLMSILRGDAGLNECSNIFVISRETEKAINRNINGRISDERTRKTIFDNTYLMLLCVVDEGFETVTIYHRGLKRPTVARFSELKRSERGKGPDITDILTAYLTSTIPSI